jgi:hypothetical protein
MLWRGSRGAPGLPDRCSRAQDIFYDPAILLLLRDQQGLNRMYDREGQSGGESLGGLGEMLMDVDATSIAVPVCSAID